MKYSRLQLFQVPLFQNAKSGTYLAPEKWFVEVILGILAILVEDDASIIFSHKNDTFTSFSIHSNTHKISRDPRRITGDFRIVTIYKIVDYLLRARETFTAQATVQPTIGLLPMPRKPIISTCAGTEEEPANWASECMRPRVSVIL